MAGKVRYLLNRGGRYFARLVIPKELRPFMDKRTELRSALGADYRQALRNLPGAVTALQHNIALAERRAAGAGAAKAAPGRYPLQNDQIAQLSYQQRLAQDDQARNANPHYAGVGIDDGFVAQLRSGMAGTLTDLALKELVGHRIDHFVRAGNTGAIFGSEDWRSLARAICISEYEAIGRIAERDEGTFDGIPTIPLMLNAAPPMDDLPPVSIRTLFSDYVASRQLIGSQRDHGKRQEPVVQSLIEFVKHEDARRLTRRNIIDWRDKLMKTLAPKTVSDIYLSAIRSMLTWAVDNERLSENAAASVKQAKRKNVYSRERGYTAAEATAVLQASQSYMPLVWINGKVREHASTVAAKRWAPILCAFTGARISEMTQLRKQDIRQEGLVHILRITPDAGTVKAGGYRDVPIHPQIIEQGFLNFVESSRDGPLFNRSPSADPNTQLRSSKRLANQIAEWLGSLNLVPDGLWPNHAFRHRFKTVGRDIGVSDRVIDAICGHAGRTAGDSYGDVTIVARARVISQFPSYVLT